MVGARGLEHDTFVARRLDLAPAVEGDFALIPAHVDVPVGRAALLAGKSGGFGVHSRHRVRGRGIFRPGEGGEEGNEEFEDGVQHFETPFCFLRLDKASFS